MEVLDARLSSSQLGTSTRLISLAGEIDLWRVPELHEALEAAVEDGTRKVVVDLRGATFVDSSVLGALSLACKRLGARGGDLVLVCDDARVLRTFKVSGLDGVFRFERSVQEALVPSEQAA